jgi:signal transduction histidine kinase
LTHATDALVLLLEDEGEWFRVCARRGDGTAGLLNGRLSVGDSLNGLVVLTGQPLVSHDAMTDPRADQARARRLNVRTVAIAPLLIQGSSIGTIAVHNKVDGAFTRAEVEALCSFANLAAIAINNTRLFGELLQARNEIQQKAQELHELLARTIGIQENERQRIAGDIHDRVVPLIVGAWYEVEACLELNPGPEGVREQLRRSQQLLGEALEEMRTAIFNLWPATLDQIGLIPAIRELISRQQKASGIKHRLRVRGTPYALSPSATIAVYRIVQEAVTNARQHSSATSLDLLIRFSPQRVHVLIRDDGTGFDIQEVTPSSRERHFGLIAMRERALSIGGQLRVRSAPGKGTQITLIVSPDGNRQEIGIHAPYSCADS